MFRDWIQRQNTLKKWRDNIWESNNTKGQKTYVNWHMDFFSRFYKAPEDQNHVILDVGCGYMLKNFEQAGKLELLKEILGAKYVGIDPADDFFKISNSSGFKFYKGLGESLPFENEQFDSVMLLGVLDHVVKPEKVLKEANRVLKPSGKLWFANSFISGDKVSIFFTKLHHLLGFDEHHRFVWKTDDLERMIKKTNFSILKTDYCSCDVSYYIEAVKSD